MNKTLLLVLAIICLQGRDSFAQKKNKGYEIYGDLRSIPDASVIYLSIASFTDSAAVVNGKFMLKGYIREPGRASLVLKHRNQVMSKFFSIKKDSYNLFLENSKMTFTAKDSLSDATVHGNRFHDEYLAYSASLSKIYDKMRPLNMSYYKYERQNNITLMKELRYKLDSLGAIEFAYVTGYVRKHPGSPVSLFAVMQFAKPIANPPDYPAAFLLLNKSLQETESGRQLQKRIADENAFKTGDLMPDFSQPDTLGKIVHLHDFKGKYVFVDFWASWCGPCRLESPNVKRSFLKYKNKGFVVISVSIDGSKESWLKAIKDDGIQEFVQVSDLKGHKNEAAQLLKIKSVPQNFLIGPSGKILGKNLHGLELQDMMERIQE